jgi:hypothetical protein
MNVLQGLQAAQAEADPEFFQNFEEEGADADEEEFWDNLDIGKLSRYELRNHLAARDLSTKGRKRDLMIRLEESIQNDKAEAQALREAKEAFFRKEVDLEESGSVYAIGRNGDGQLGLGHLEDVDEWSCLKELRGLAVKHVAAVCTYMYIMSCLSCHVLSCLSVCPSVSNACMRLVKWWHEFSFVDLRF